ncbi:MAG: hypothetical protein G3M78_14970 [Candidatus Nitrohelix vancouverensis]|uniref:Uncharacterized protein n=1 Tax=Candidatus Nitrohelix vancouverensis TaxID=2705534 RepID=A0A7T0G4Q9_9BACT|nr:MAG: hypothetical protein G3M78_14970 [Candidatus Nitrohelix vancouverensis]
MAMMKAYYKSACALTTLIFALTLLQGCGGGEEIAETVALNPEVISSGLRSKADLPQAHGLPPDEATVIIKPEELEKAEEASEDVRKFLSADQFKTDTEYLAMNRFERVARYVPKPYVPSSDFAAGLESNFPMLSDPFIFSGEGFEINGFETRSKHMNQFDYDEHLRTYYPYKAPEKPEDHLIQVAAFAKNEKQLIFHPASPAWGSLPDVDDTSPPSTQKASVLLDEPVEETRLGLSLGGGTRMVLRRSSKALDLIKGNEAINRHRFENAE